MTGGRISEQELEDIKARVNLADVAGGYVKLRRAGSRLVGPCPICGGRASSQRFEVLAGGDAWVCAVCQDGGDVIRLVEKAEGCDFRSAIERLGGRAAVDPGQARQLFEAREAKRVAREKENERYREAERKRLWRQWDSALPIHDTLAADYLAGRRLLVPEQCPGLRFLPSAIYWHGETIDSYGRSGPRALHTGPALLAAFIRADGRFGGLHMTFLSAAAPPAKAELADPETGEMLPAKKMRGSKTGAYIEVARAPAGTEAVRRLVIGEGIETVLSLRSAFIHGGRDISDMGFWAAGDLGNMAGRATETVAHPALKTPSGRPQRVPGPVPDPDDRGLTIPDHIEELLLLGDGDSEPVLTQNAMIRAARRYNRPGRVIRIVFAPVGMDFNDLLQSDMDSAGLCHSAVRL